MVKQINMTRPRVRLTNGRDTSAAIERIYTASQLDRGGGLVRVNRHGELVGGPTGFPGSKADQQSPQFREDQQGAGYSNNTRRSWVHGSNATARPGFDASPKRGKERR